MSRWIGGGSDSGRGRARGRARGFKRTDIDGSARDARKARAALVRGQGMPEHVDGEGVAAGVDGRAARSDQWSG